MSDVEILEAIGYGPDSEIAVTQPLILGADIHSDLSRYSDTQKVSKAPHGGVSFSMERWLRMHFVAADSTGYSNLRFWIPDLHPGAEWDLLMGVSFDWRKPRNTQSDIATSAIPSSDPGGGAGANVYPLPDNSDTVIDEYGPWIVLQAIWFGGSNAPFQDVPFTLRFGWDEG